MLRSRASSVRSVTKFQTCPSAYLSRINAAKRVVRDEAQKGTRDQLVKSYVPMVLIRGENQSAQVFLGQDVDSVVALDAARSTGSAIVKDLCQNLRQPESA